MPPISVQTVPILSVLFVPPFSVQSVPIKGSTQRHERLSVSRLSIPSKNGTLRESAQGILWPAMHELKPRQVSPAAPPICNWQHCLHFFLPFPAGHSIAAHGVGGQSAGIGTVSRLGRYVKNVRSFGRARVFSHAVANVADWCFSSTLQISTPNAIFTNCQESSYVHAHKKWLQKRIFGLITFALSTPRPAGAGYQLR